MPSPYFSDDHVTIFCADCREILPQFEVGMFDLCLTDFPYGNDTRYDIYEDTRENLQALIDGAMPEILRTSKRALITCGNANMRMYPEPDWTLAWIVRAGSGSGPWGFSCWQPILAYGNDPYLKEGLGRRPDIIEKIEIADKFGHPCPKPYDFWMTLLIRGSTHEGEYILDPFMGSGMTLLVARATGRLCVGIELSEQYCELATERYLREPPLFTFC